MRPSLLLEAAEQAPMPPEDRWFSPIAGALIGGAAADALGWITEFVRGPEHLRKLYRTTQVTEYRGWQKTSGGRFNAYVDHINKGEYSDDTQLTLAVARSLRGDGTVDLHHFSKTELPLWLDYARGGGATMMAAARAIARRSAAWNRNFFTYKQGGQERSYRYAGANGAAMRAGPIALANVRDRPTMGLGVWQTSIVTHGHPRAILGSLVYADVLRRSAAGELDPSPHALADEVCMAVENSVIPDDSEIKQWRESWDAGQAIEFKQLWNATRKELLGQADLIAKAIGPTDVQPIMRRLGCYEPATKGSGTATVMAALLIFGVLGHDFRQAVLTTVNQLGTDTDTIGGFVGGLCGAYHGYDAVPPEWASELQDYEYFMRIATELARIAARKGLGGRALLPEKVGEARQLPNLLERLRDRDINAHERVYHPLFGPGWVESVDAQRLRRKDGAQVVFARVRFDSGQSCKFRYMQFPRKSSRQ